MGLVGLGFIKKRIKIKANVYSRVPSKVLTYCPFRQILKITFKSKFQNIFSASKKDSTRRLVGLLVSRGGGGLFC